MKPYDYQHPYFLRTLAERLDRKFPALSSDDPDYVFHEIAHHILLTQVQPRDSSDFRFIEEVIGEMSVGRAQMHELRTCALQVATWHRLGFQHSFRRALALSWSGIRDAVDYARRDYDNDCPVGRVIVRSKTQALRILGTIRPSERNIQTFIATIRRFARELDVRPLA